LIIVNAGGLREPQLKAVNHAQDRNKPTMPLTPLAFSPTDTPLFRSRLTKRRQELTSRLRAIQTDFERPHNPDDDDRAMERNNDEVLEELGEAGQTELAAVDAALDRLADGTYGNCVKCGSAIDRARLDAVPHTLFCQDCARAL
jgi:RNA polymerase-binding transcription factor DksA